MSSEETPRDTGADSTATPPPQPAPAETQPQPSSSPEKQHNTENEKKPVKEEKKDQSDETQRDESQQQSSEKQNGEETKEEPVEKKEKSPKKHHKSKKHHEGDEKGEKKAHPDGAQEGESEQQPQQQQDDPKGGNGGGSSDNTPRRKKRAKSKEPAAAIYTNEMTDHVLPPLTSTEIARREMQWSYTTTIDKVDAFQQSRLKKLRIPGETLGSQTTNGPTPSSKASQEKAGSKTQGQVSSSVDLQKAMRSAGMWLKLKNGDDTVLRASGVITPTGESRSNFYVPAAPSLTKTFERDENYRLPKVPAAAGGAHTARSHHSQSRHPKQHPSARGAGRGN
jgi:hypothetical protein